VRGAREAGTRAPSSSRASSPDRGSPLLMGRGVLSAPCPQCGVAVAAPWVLLVRFASGARRTFHE
jgi:hypothetical protein